MSEAISNEADERFPSGKWTGFFLDRRKPGKHQMELHLNFADGTMSGEGRDRVGEFEIKGTYDTVSGECLFSKCYLARHSIKYRGFNEGKGIWGVWEMVDWMTRIQGGFHIWPEGMSDPSNQTLKEEAELPLELLEESHEEELAPATTNF